MPSVNMIAARRAEKQRLEQSTRKIVYAIVAEAGLALLLASVFTLRFVTVHNQISELNGQIKSLAPRVAQIQQLQEDTDKLQPKLTALNTARDTTMFWYSTLESLSSSLTPSTWLTGLTTAGVATPTAPAPFAAVATTATTSTTAAPGPAAAPAAGASITLQGMSTSQSEVGKTMLAMNKEPSVGQVTLNFVQHAQIGKQDLVNFAVVIQLKPNIVQKTSQPAAGSGSTQTALGTEPPGLSFANVAGPSPGQPGSAAVASNANSATGGRTHA